MKKLAIILLGLMVASCATLSVKNPINETHLAMLEASYGIALSGAVNYRRLPLCADNVKQPCSEKNVVIKLQKADLVTQEALKTARKLVRDNPTLDPSDALTALSGAIDTFKRIQEAK